ncbi:MAG: cysteine--tRNA ligase [Alphaproteobacteria bacterium]|nr:cysteine--tRNA ligase [Alphaproteobacteria bacterium]
MQIKLTNTLSRKLEAFKPAGNKKIQLYVCGPTVYDHPHIGNARALVVYDLLYRLLIAVYEDYEVIYVRNITDIDDKIIIRSQEEGINITDLTSKITESFHNSCNYLNCLTPTFEPKASEHLDTMEYIISKLIENKCAYESENHIYFSVESFEKYGELANKNIKNLKAGARIEIAEAKRNSADFVLWKPAGNDELGFNSRWGRGRPGWHIECSAMSYKFLGVDFDIHGGGADLMFPHHSNEIAQSCSAFPGSSYARFWIHNGFVTVKGEKMSKSLGNFITVNDLEQQKINGEVVRMALLSSNYRAPLDYNIKLLHDMETNLHYFYRALRDFDNLDTIPFKNLPEEFTSPILDDLNTSLAIAYMTKLSGIVNKEKDPQKASLLFSCGKFLGIFNQSPKIWLEGNSDNETIEKLIAERLSAKQEKNWIVADNIRNKLIDMGVLLEDTKDGKTIWTKNRLS